MSDNDLSRSSDNLQANKDMALQSPYNERIFTSQSSATYSPGIFESYESLNGTELNSLACPFSSFLIQSASRKLTTSSQYKKLSSQQNGDNTDMKCANVSNDVTLKTSGCPNNEFQVLSVDNSCTRIKAQSIGTCNSNWAKARMAVLKSNAYNDLQTRKLGMAKPKNTFYEVTNLYLKAARQEQKPSISVKSVRLDGVDVEKCETNNMKLSSVKKESFVNNTLEPTNSCNSSGKSVYGRFMHKKSNMHRFVHCKQLTVQKTRACNYCLFFAMVGIAFTILEAELVANKYTDKMDQWSILLRCVIVFSTLMLLSCVIWYHAIEIKMYINDNGLTDWRVAITTDRMKKLAIELLICSICPFPNTINIDWIVLMDDHRQIRIVKVSLDVLLSMPMFLRFYLLCRFVGLHSHHFQDASTRGIASLNRCTLNFSFVLKTLIHEHPLYVLCGFTISFCILMAWLLTQCERFDGVLEDNHYLNALWFIIITFKSIGYGDLVPNTYCGRILAITTGIVGAVVSSTLIAIIGMKLELSRAEKHVNNFMRDSKLTRQRKERAATVLQHIWFIHKYRNLLPTGHEAKLRYHQRKFLAAINEFRNVKWGQRKLAERGNALVDLAKLQNDTNSMILLMQQKLDDLSNQMSLIRHQASIFRTPIESSSSNLEETFEVTVE